MACAFEKIKKGERGMNVKLRKRHRYIWMVMGIALPLLCLEAIEGIPENPLKNIPRHSCLLDIGVCGIDAEEFSLSIEESTQEERITIKVSAPLKSAFTIAYLSNEQTFDSSAKPLGAIHTMGSYVFDMVGNQGQYLLLYDKLNDVTIYHQALEVKP